MEQQSIFTRCVFARECVHTCIYFVAVQAVVMSLFVYLFMHQSWSTPSLPSPLSSLPSPPLPSPAAECCKGCFGRPPARPGGDRKGREECTACAEQSTREQRDAVGGRSLPCGTRKIRQAGQGTVHSKSILPSISLHE